MNIEKRKQRTTKFRKTEAWQHLRSELIQCADGRCECPGNYKNGGALGSTRCQNGIDDIHHLVYPIVPQTLTADELIGLCLVCHQTCSVFQTPPCCRYVHRRALDEWLKPTEEQQGADV